MTVRIDSNVPTPNSGSSERIANAKSTGSVPSLDRRDAKASSGGQIASDSASISALATKLGNFPSVRQQRVQALQQMVQSGTYQVDGTQVAQSMLGDLFGTGSQS